MKNFESFKNRYYPIVKINIMLNKMNPYFKKKIFNFTNEKKDIRKALFELSKKSKIFNMIWREFLNNLYFSHQNQP